MKRAALLTCFVLLAPLAACSGGGGGGGDQQAFCDDLQALSDQVADGDLATDRGLDDVLDTVNDLIADADKGDQLDAVNEVADVVEAAKTDDADQTANDIQDQLADFADDPCNLDGEFAAPPEVTTTTRPDTTTTDGGSGGTDTTADGGGGGSDQIEINARQPIPADLEADFTADAQACFDGDMATCDQLFLETPIGSVAEDYGRSCAGRFETDNGGQCSDVITAPTPPGADVTDTANAQACFGGDMAACDAQFNAAEAGSADQLYGGLCANRVPFTRAFCVDIFGPTAFQ
jgi:hypothetical protein